MAVLADRTHRRRALGDQPAPDLARPERRAGGQRPLVAGGRHPSARYWSEASKERTDPAGVFYFWNGERPRHPDAPRLEGIGEIKLESEDRASGYWTTRSDRLPEFHARTSGVYLRADPADLAVLDGNDAPRRAELIAERLRDWDVDRERLSSAQRDRVPLGQRLQVQELAPHHHQVAPGQRVRAHRLSGPPVPATSRPTIREPAPSGSAAYVIATGPNSRGRASW